MAKWVEYFIATRTAEGGEKGCVKGDERRGISSSIATLAVALSLAVMILTIAVVAGFKSEIHNRLTALSGEIVVATYRGVEPNPNLSIRRSTMVESAIEKGAKRSNSPVRYITPYAARGVVVQGAESVEGVILKGLDSSAPREIFERGLIEGELPLFGGETPSRNAIISKELASEMRLSVGDRITTLATNNGGEIRRDLYRVGAIYSAGVGSAERGLIVTDMRNVQRLNSWTSEQISGYEVGVTNRANTVLTANEINRAILFNEEESSDLEGVAAYDVEQLYPALFDWLDALDLNAVVVVVIMMVVAIFNIITAILILVLERMQMVGILKTLGMRDRAIANIFLHRALRIALRGMAWGNGVGIGVALLQRHFEIVKLDEAGYLLTSVPIELDVVWVALLNVGVVVTILLSVLLPSRIVSSIEPHKAIKFQ